VDFAAIDPIARAILYEGHLLYPYRTTSLKNRQPCAFGSVFPRAHAQATGDIEPWSMQIECLACGDDSAVLQGWVRFLQSGCPDAVEREVALTETCLSALPMQPRNFEFSYVLDGATPLQGVVRLSAEHLGPSVLKVRVLIENQTPAGTMAHTMLSTHAVLAIRGGRFLSLIDPPDEARPLAEACQNRGAWPVLVGDRALHNLVLAAPIILDDFPEIAPESPGNLFDGTEIDELLTLRILTLSDTEKEAMKGHASTRTLLERTESLASDQMLAMHGTLRTRSVPANTADHRLGPGDRVIVRPRGRADVLDLALDGKSATIVSVEQDLEGRVYYSLAMDDDPGHDLGIAGKPGHRFYFRRDELEWIHGEA
jgi:hypothetical protein